ncbi:cupin domain-containing protein [Streptomyces globisporus]|uniref:cupin domain-containing protein n=1 Tax=Streptomyces globisporus TaxID=1908 RepID=UPI00364C8689
MITAEYGIEALGLEEHVEGGYFRRTFQADHRPRISTAVGDRYTLTSITTGRRCGTCPLGPV